MPGGVALHFHFLQTFFVDAAHCVFGFVENGNGFVEIGFADVFEIVHFIAFYLGFIGVFGANCLSFVGSFGLLFELYHHFCRFPRELFEFGLHFNDLGLQLCNFLVGFPEGLEADSVLADASGEHSLLVLHHLDV
jgi:hypothetical protein